MPGRAFVSPHTGPCMDYQETLQVLRYNAETKIYMRVTGDSWVLRN